MIVSKKLRESAGHPDARCMVNILGVCPDHTESKTHGCVLAHLRYAGNAGGAQKPDDICATFACGPCHTVLDSNGTNKGLRRGSEEWLDYAFRGQNKTLRWWYDHGYLNVKGAK